jgi:hypothetical protein
MTFHLIPSSRRRFLQATVAGGVASLACRAGVADTPAASNCWALLADTHIAGDENTIVRGTNMFDNLNRVIDEVIDEDPLPAGAIINGDCAYLKGLDSDYATLRRAVRRLIDAGIPVHMAMGNHDDRGPFYDNFSDQKQEHPLVAGKHVVVLETEMANLFLLDSLKQVNVVTGQLGESQLQWLLDALGQRDDKPAIVIGHHNPQHRPKGSTAKVTGLADTEALFNTLHSQPQVQAFVFGHSHDWKLNETPSGLRLINQPPCAYVFNKSRPSGWVRMTLAPEEFSVELRSLDKSHPQHGEKHVLSHRLAAAK